MDKLELCNPAKFENFETYKEFVIENCPDLPRDLRNKVRDAEFMKDVNYGPMKMSPRELEEKGIRREFWGPCVHHYIPLMECRARTLHDRNLCQEEKTRYQRCLCMKGVIYILNLISNMISPL